MCRAYKDIAVLYYKTNIRQLTITREINYNGLKTKKLDLEWNWAEANDMGLNRWARLVVGEIKTSDNN